MTLCSHQIEAAHRAYCAHCEEHGEEPRELDEAWVEELYAHLHEHPELTISACGVCGAPAHEPAPVDTIVVGQCPTLNRAYKRYRVVDGELVVEDYELGGRILSMPFSVSGLVQLHKLLVWLEAKPQRWIMRGDIREGKDPAQMHRRRARSERGEPVYTHGSRRWIMVDIDDVDWPDGVEPGDGLGCAEMMIRRLPSMFHSAGFIWQFSQSAGVKGWDKVKLHLWFWLDRPVCDDSLRDWFKRRAPWVDRAPFNPVQPHYTALPQFEGVTDPLEGRARLGFVPGPVVVSPRGWVDLDTWEKMVAAKHARTVKARQRVAKARQEDGQVRGYAIGAVKSAAQKIRDAGVGQRHETIRDESLATARFVSAGDISESEWREALESAAYQVLPMNRWREVKRLLDGALRVDQRGAA